jgi:peptide/nickel transport system substrate-binding protein
MLVRKASLGLALATIASLVMSCAPGTPSAPTGSGQAAPAVSSAPKTLIVGRLREPATIEGFTGEGGTAGGAGETRAFIHAHLTEADYRDEYVPRLATELPSFDKGTWRANADGTMDVIWSLRPNVKWHDGAPFTSSDLAFSLMLHKDPDLPTAYATALASMVSAETPDPLTLVVHWSRVDTRAMNADGLSPMPRHLLEQLYLTDKASFVNSPRFTTDWVGLGPYKLVRWEQGSHMELARFDDYILGRPAFDSVIIRFYFDGNTMAAAVLAEALDVVLPPGVDLDAAVEIKQRWEGTGHVVRVEAIPRLADLEIQFRPELARPMAGLRDRTVRQAFYQAINRQELAGVMSHGLAPIADSWVRPSDPLRTELAPSIPQYPYDPAEATRLLAQAGWARGADGVLVHQPDGERFESELRTIPQYGEKPAAVIASDWKAIGADIQIFNIPPSRASERELLSTHMLALVTGSFFDGLPERLDGRLISTAANRWTGRNQSGWVNSRYDEILDQLAVTLDPRQRAALTREQQQIMMSDIARMPLYWEVRPVLYLRSMRGDIFPYNTPWNLQEWDKAS